MLATGRSVVGLATTNLQEGYAASKWRLSAAITPLDSFIVSGHARFSDMLMHAGKAHTVPARFSRAKTFSSEPPSHGLWIWLVWMRNPPVGRCND